MIVGFTATIIIIFNFYYLKSHQLPPVSYQRFESESYNLACKSNYFRRCIGGLGLETILHPLVGGNLRMTRIFFVKRKCNFLKFFLSRGC